MQKYISPGAWFSIEYPSDWHEFEDTEESFLFYNPDKWNGNFRISAYIGENKGYAQYCMDEELKHVDGARATTVGDWKCIYSVESFQENGAWYTTHIWITGAGAVSVECSFTVAKGESIRVAEAIIASLRVRQKEERVGRVVIPVRVSEISVINEDFEWASTNIKKQLTKDFTSIKKDIDSIQKIIDSGRFSPTQKHTWECLGVAFGTILINEMDGMDWVTVIDGNKEYPALQFKDTDIMVYPTTLILEKVKNNQPCNLAEEYKRIEAEVEAVL